MAHMDTQISVRAVAVTSETLPTSDYLLDCTECGAMGVYDSDEVNRAALLHLQGHGVDLTGFNLPR